MSIKIAVPPREERREILSFIATESLRLDTAIVHSEREVSLLREYRTRLITDVVTGKLDVREVAASLPEEAEEELDAFEEAESLSDNGSTVKDGEEALTGATDEN